MFRFLHAPIYVLFLLIACSGFLQPQNLNARTAAPHLLDCDGRQVNPFSNPEAKLLAFIFVRTDCPISNTYAPEIQRLYTRFLSHGVAFWLVYPDADESPAAIRKHLREFSYSCSALRDPSHALTKRSQVDVTPEAALFRGDGELVYHGRIDNRFANFGKARPHATRHDLEEAIEDTLAGKAVIPASEPAIGCFIEGTE